MSGAYESWLAAQVRGDRRNGAWDLYAQYRAWLLAVERLAKQRQFVLRRVQENPILARLGAVALYDVFAALSLRVELAFERLARRVFQRRHHHALKNVGQGQVLGQDGFKGVVEGHSGLSRRVRPGDDAESAGSGNRPAGEAAGGRS